MLTTTQKGDIAELRVTAALVAQGRIVLKPVSATRFDIAILDGGSVLTVQIKTGRLDGTSIVFNTCTTHRVTFKRSFYQVDYFGVFCPDTNQVFMVPAKDLNGKYEGRLSTVDGARRGPQVPSAKQYLVP